MNESNIRKLLQLMGDGHKILFNAGYGIFKDFSLTETDMVVFRDEVIYTVPFSELSPENFFVTIPLTQVKRGLQPQ